MILGPLLVALVQQPRPVPLLPDHPRDPFVFRCVLDQRPRMITAALDADMWVAWDAQTCALYKAWKGDVRFDGPVYTAVHGPQPTTHGTDYTTAVEGNAWSAWRNGQPVACTASYAGYRVALNVVTLEWRVHVAGGATVDVDETPEFVRPKEFFSAEQLDDMVLGAGDEPGLRRTFAARGLPADTQIDVTMRSDGVAAKFGQFERERFDDVKDARGVITQTRMFSQVPLTHAAPQQTVVMFFHPPPAEAPASSDKR